MIAINSTEATSPQARVAVLILNGFLGSGKTTLLRSLIIQSRKQELLLGVVVNDMSELDVDGLIVAQSEFFEPEDKRFQSIYSCVLSSKTGITKLQQALEAMQEDGSLDLIIVETSGSCHPMPLIDFFASQAQYLLTGVLTLVDSAMVDQDYDAGQQIVPIMQRNLQNGQRDTTNLLVEQVMFCSHLMLTKVDRIEQDRLQQIAQSLHLLNPYVSVASIPFGNLALDDVLGMPEYEYQRVEQLIHELKPVLANESHDDRPYNLATRVLTDDRPFHPQRLWDTCQQHLGQQIYRSKGFFYLATRDNVSLLWNQAAAGISLELIGYWRAGVLEDENQNLDEAEIEGLKEWLEKEPGRFGDRRCQLTIIGDETQVDWFADALKQCFLTDNEIEHWQAGGDFPDPWPDSYVTRQH